MLQELPQAETISVFNGLGEAPVESSTAVALPNEFAVLRMSLRHCETW